MTAAFPPTRRDVLRVGAAAAVAGAGVMFLPGLRVRAAPPACTAPGPGIPPFPARPPGVPQPDLAPELAPIDHIVLLMEENKSFDAYFGMLPHRQVTAGRLAGRVDGWRQLDAAGRPLDTLQDADGSWYQAFPMSSSCAPEKPDVSWDLSHRAFDGGRLDGFVRNGSGAAAMGYWDDAILPAYYSLARSFPVGDRYFSSVLAPTDPNRLFSICASAVGTTTTMRPPNGLTQVSPPNGHIFERLDSYGIPWMTVAANAPTAALIAGGYAAARVGRNILLTGSNEGTVAAVTALATANALPAFLTVEPDFVAGSEENPGDIDAGQWMVGQVVTALMSAPAVWARTLILLCFDESGGYYDHVVPPSAPAPGDGLPPGLPPSGWYGDAYTRYGFRVPNLVISPWAKADHVSHVVRDHGSILRTLAVKWNLPALTMRDALADDFRECLVAAGPAPFATPPPVAAVPHRTAADSLACQQNPSRSGPLPPAVPAPAQATVPEAVTASPPGTPCPAPSPAPSMPPPSLPATSLPPPPPASPPGSTAASALPGTGSAPLPAWPALATVVAAVAGAMGGRPGARRAGGESSQREGPVRTG